jgi:hypothetical protein
MKKFEFGRDVLTAMEFSLMVFARAMRISFHTERVVGSEHSKTTTSDIEE